MNKKKTDAEDMIIFIMNI